MGRVASRVAEQSGVWADGVCTLAEQRLEVSAPGFAVLDDPGYARALRLGTWFDQAAAAAGGGAGGSRGRRGADGHRLRLFRMRRGKRGGHGLERRGD